MEDSSVEMAGIVLFMEFTPPYLLATSYNPLIYFFKFHDAVKVVSIHKNNRFGIKN
jgi:hypothetical protein